MKLGIDDAGVTEISLEGGIGIDLAAGLHDSPVLQLRYTAIPEPQVIRIGLLGAAALLFKRSRRRANS